MKKPEFTSQEISRVISVLTQFKVKDEPVFLERGYGNENWLIETEKKKLILKIGPKNASINKWKATIKAIEMVKSARVKTSNLILFEEQCKLLSNRVARIFDYIEGITADDLLKYPELLEKFFSQLGLEVKKLHQIQINFFSSRVDGSDTKFKTWKEYLGYRVSQIHERALKSGLFSIEQLNILWNQLFLELDKINHLIKPALSHRDLHLNNLIASIDGDLMGIIDFDGAEAWDPVADFYKLKWWVFEKYPKARDAFIKTYGEPEKVYDHFKLRLQIVEIIETINYITQETEPDYLEENINQLKMILSETKWEYPLN